jgi:hypothetical protein
MGWFGWNGMGGMNHHTSIWDGTVYDATHIVKIEYDGQLPQEVKTSKLLAEWNKVIDLASVAKGKTFDEFVKSQGTPVYHQTNENIKSFDKDNPVFFNTFKRPATYGKNTVDSIIKYKKPFESKEFYWTQEEQLKKIPELKRKGYDSVIFRNPDDGKIQGIISLNPLENVKTKSQLTEIWKKANNK